MCIALLRNNEYNIDFIMVLEILGMILWEILLWCNFHDISTINNRYFL